MSQPGQPVPDAALTAALGGYYGHPTAITDADPDIVDGLTAGLAAGLAEARKDERATVAEEARTVAASMKATGFDSSALAYFASLLDEDLANRGTS